MRSYKQALITGLAALVLAFTAPNCGGSSGGSSGGDDLVNKYPVAKATICEYSGIDGTPSSGDEVCSPAWGIDLDYFTNDFLVFDGSKSTDAEGGDNYRCEWDTDGNGSFETSDCITGVVYSENNCYYPILRVIDNVKDTDSEYDQLMVDVGGSCNP